MGSSYIRKGKNVLINLGVFLLSCMVSIGIGELLARAFLSPPQSVLVKRASDLDARQRFERIPVELEVPDGEEHTKGFFFVMTPTGRRLRANTQVIISNHWLSKQRIEIVTNGLGYRGPEIAPKRRTRVLFLGDSITLGAYLQEKDLFVRRVEGLAQQNGRNWETVNAGVAGTSLKNSLSILLETGLSIEPDVVVLGFYLNDFLDSFGVYVHEPPTILKGSWVLHHLFRIFSVYKAPERVERDYTAFYPDDYQNIDTEVVSTLIYAYRDTLQKDHTEMWRHEEYRLSQWKRAFIEQLNQTERTDSERRAFFKQVLESFGDWGGAWSPQSWEYMRPLFEAFKRLSIKHNFKLIVVCFPVRPQVEATPLFDYPQRRLDDITRSLNIPFLDLLPLFRESTLSGSEELFYDHCHHTPNGNRVIAESLYRFLEGRI